MLVTDVILTGTAHAQLYDTHVSAQAENKVLKNEVNDLRYIYWNHGTSARIPTAKEHVYLTIQYVLFCRLHIGPRYLLMLTYHQ